MSCREVPCPEKPLTTTNPRGKDGQGPHSSDISPTTVEPNLGPSFDPDVHAMVVKLHMFRNDKQVIHVFLGVTGVHRPSKYDVLGTDVYWCFGDYLINSFGSTKIAI